MLLDLTTHVQGRLDYLTPGQQAGLLRGLAVLGYLPRAAFLKQYMMCSRSKLSGMSPTDYAAIIAALAEFRWGSMCEEAWQSTGGVCVCKMGARMHVR